jgi:hypothetical protein
MSFEQFYHSRHSLEKPAKDSNKKIVIERPRLAFARKQRAAAISEFQK